MDEAGLVKGIYCIHFKAVASCSSPYSEEDFLRNCAPGNWQCLTSPAHSCAVVSDYVEKYFLHLYCTGFAI